MSQISPRLALPYLQPSQAQKHVTLNEALQQLDAIVQLSISGFDATTPPAAPEAGEVHALGTGASGLWAGQDGRLALWQGSGWQFLSPQEGWLAWDLTSGGLRLWQGSGWQGLHDGLAGLGIGTAADATNRLSIASDASLFSHDGAGHQMKLNKATDSDTASVLFQSGWTGHAEMGLAGDTDFSLKLSADGSTWVTVLRADPGGVQLEGTARGSAVQSGALDHGPGKLALAEHTYGPGNLLGSVGLGAGQPTGAVIETGSTADGRYTRWADGTQICTKTLSFAAEDLSTAFGSLYRSGNLLAGETGFAMGFAETPSYQIQITGTNAPMMLATQGSASPTDSPGIAYALSPVSLTGQALSLSLCAVGRWAIA